MKKKKLLIIFITLFSFVFLVSCNRDEKEALISSFLNTYYNQMYFTNDDIAEIKEDIEKSSTTIYLDIQTNKEIENENSFDSVKYFNNYRNLISLNCLNNLIVNRNLPNFNLKINNIKKSSVDIVSIEKVSQDIYKVDYELHIELKNNIKTDYKNTQEFTIIKKDDKYLIDNIQNDFINFEK